MLDKLRSGSRKELVRLVYRKAIHRHTLMGRWEVRAGDSVAPSSDPGHLRIEIASPETWDEVADHNPYLDADALAHLRRQDSTCIVARDGDRLAASTWMTRGTVFVHDLQRSVHVGDGEHFSCRTYVDDRYRGFSLMSHLIHHHAVRHARPDDRIWGLVFSWNEASIRGLEKLGWRRTGDESTRWVLDRPIAKHRSYPPRPPLVRLSTSRSSGQATAPVSLIVTEESWGGTLHAARSLDALGAPVLIASTGTGAAVFGRSRYCSAAADFDPTDPERFCADVAAWAGRHANGQATIPVIPCSDRLAEILDAGRRHFPPPFRLIVPDPGVVAELVDKGRSIAVAQAAGLDVLPSAVVRSPADLPAAGAARLPVIVRPVRSPRGDRAAPKLVICRTAGERDGVLVNLLAAEVPVVVQEYLEVPADAIEFAIVWRSADRSVTTVCTGRKRRQADRDGGVMAWGEAVDLPDVRRAAEQFLDRSGFTGLGGIEFIRARGRLWFVEFNPRLEATHFLATAAGVDTVAFAYQDLALDQRSSVPVRQQPATAWMGTAWLARLRSEPDSWRTALSDRRAFGRSPTAVRAIWDPRDPLPGLAVVARLVRSALRRGAAR